MARKIRIVGLTITVIVLIVGMIMISVTASSKIGDVKSLELIKTTTDSASLKWKKIGSADGYFIYQKDGKKYKKIATIKDSSTSTFDVKKLDNATYYDFAVKAYKNVRDKVVSSENYIETSACTYPVKQDLKISALEEGTLQFDLLINENAGGYEIEYSKSKDFEDSKTINLKKPTDIKKKVDKLKIGDIYYARARSYIYFNEEKLYGDWSKVVKEKVVSLKELTKVDPKKKMIAVTFDDGPGYNKASDRIVDVIEKYHIKATFFMVGNNAAAHPKNVQRKVKLGCEIGNHTTAHAHYGKNVTPQDISKATEQISKAGGGVKVVSFRSTGGATTDVIRAECKKEGMPLYYWSLDTLDWKSRNADAVYNKVMKNVRDGDIILMHEIYDSTAEAFERMVPELIKQGYQFVTCEELVTAKTGKKPVPGTQYLDGKTIKNNTY